MDESIAEMFEIEDKAAVMDEIMTRYGQEILQLVYSYVHNKEVAEDLTQDIFVKCYQSLHIGRINSNTIRFLGQMVLEYFSLLNQHSAWL